MTDPIREALSDSEIIEFFYSFAESKALVGVLYREDALRFARAIEHAALARPVDPIPMVLYCPSCGKQHIDRDESPSDREWSAQSAGDREAQYWTNPPHRSHLCHACRTIWRPADVATTGVESLLTKGGNDTWPNSRLATKALARPVDQGAAVPVAKVRVRHKGYSMELSTYVAYALPEGMHELYAAPQLPSVDQGAVPEGWKLVPIEPTIGIIHAMVRHGISLEGAKETYALVLYAAPTHSPGPAAADAIARSKRILALVDDYVYYQNAKTRTALRQALHDEFSAPTNSPEPAVAVPDERAEHCRVPYRLPNGAIVSNVYKAYEIGVAEGKRLYGVNTDAAPTHVPKNSGRDGWISVEGRFPDDDELVLIVRCGRITAGSHFETLAGNHFWTDDSGCAEWPSSDVSHWMPLPAAPSPEPATRADGE